MIIGIWGQAGTGNSTLAVTLGKYLTKNGTVLIVYTDLTQPTLPTYVNSKEIEPSGSIGRALNIGIQESTKYMHQDKKYKRLFYAGLTQQDTILSYEYGFESTVFAERFIDNCKQIADHIIIDLSSQRTDPFLPLVISRASTILMPFEPNTKGLCRHNSCTELIFQFKAMDKVMPIAAKVQSFHDIPKFEKNTNIKFGGAIPYIKDVAMCLDTKKDVIDIYRYARQVIKIRKGLEVR